MAVPSNTVQTFAMVGIREDLSDTITLTRTDEYPFFSSIKKGKCASRTPEWQIDSFRAADADNATIEGDDVANSSRSQPSKVKNVVQLFDETIGLSSTAQAVTAAGRNPDEMRRQVGKAIVEIKSDIEKRATGDYASVVGAAGTAGKFAGAVAWLTTNVSRGSGGADGGFNSGTGVVDASTNGTLRAFSETLLKAAIADAYTNGGRPTMGIMSIGIKQTFSGFSGVATKYQQMPTSPGSAAILGAADVYVSDVGQHRFMPSRFCSARDVLIYDPESWEFLFLQPFKDEPLAKTGHSDRRMLSAELTLRCWNEKKNAAVADAQA